MKRQRRFLAAILLLFPHLLLGSETVHHELRVQLFPGQARIQVEDRLTLPDDRPRHLLLHAGMQPEVQGGRIEADPIRNLMGGTTLRSHHLRPDAGRRTVTLRYAGKIHDPLQTHSESVGKQRQMTSGIIGPDGVFLDGGSGWYPAIPDTLQTFSMEITVPKAWLAVSQGDGPGIESARGTQTIHWRVEQPQDDIYLVAAPFQLYRDRKGKPEAQVWLREKDDALARRYLDATRNYTDLYSRLIGPYPYAKFALVENFWETGYGMPSFTLLGSRVIRLPFIVYSSYPHEILHNWWGNGVYIDYGEGNWSEGLTAYLADYLLQEQRGKDVEYRRNALQRYASFVSKEKDFPLTAFRSRHSGASQAVGYDKSLMVFHMLRRRLGDKTFIAGLQRFYKDNLFKRAAFKDIQKAFETVSSESLETFFSQWVQRTGAPALTVREVQVNRADGRFHVSARLEQTQSSPPFSLRIPVVLHRADAPPLHRQLLMNGRRATLSLESTARPLRLDIDPAFDLFRQLAPGEAPPVLNDMYGAEHGIIVLPTRAPASLYDAYQRLANRWQKGYPQLRIARDDQLDTLPDDQPVWLLGWNNRFLDEFRDQMNIAAVRGEVEKNAFEIEAQRYAGNENSVAITVRNGSTKQPIAWVAGGNTEQVQGLAFKLPHYGKYSYAVFSGNTPTIKSKGTWSVTDSPLKIPLARDIMELPSASPPAPHTLLDSLPVD